MVRVCVIREATAQGHVELIFQNAPTRPFSSNMRTKKRQMRAGPAKPDRTVIPARQFFEFPMKPDLFAVEMFEWQSKVIRDVALLSLSVSS